MSWSPRKNISAYANPASVTAIMRARAGGREYHGRAPSAAPVLSPAEAAEPDSSPAEAAEPALPSAEVAVTDRAPADNSAVFSVGPVPAVPAEDPASDREDAADSAECAPSSKVPAPSSEAPAASSVEPVLVHSAGRPLLSNAHRHRDRRALESEGLTQAAGDEPPVAVVEETGGEQHELRRTRLRLRAEEDARLLAAAHGVRIGGDQLTE